MPAINVKAYTAKDRAIGWMNGFANILLNFDIVYVTLLLCLILIYG